MFPIFIRSLKDFFDKKILLISIVPMLISAVVLGSILLIFSNNIHEFFIWIMSHIPFINGELVAGITQGLFVILIFYELIIISSVLFVGIVTDSVVDRINAKHYNLEKRGFGTLLGSMAKAIKSNIIFIILFIILIPTLFIPFLNILIHLLLWSILIKEPMFYDSLAFYANKEEFEQIKQKNKFKIWFISFVSSALFLLPMIGVFLYVLQLIIFTHFNLQNLKHSRKLQSVAFTNQTNR